MKIALIGDVHANLPALDAVLAHARAQGADAVWNVGDFIGYGPFPDEVVRRLRDVDAVSIIGNYDRKALQGLDKPAVLPKQAEKRAAFQFAAERLTPEHRAYLAAQPDERRFEALGHRILLVHASPASAKEHLGPDTPEARLRELAAVANTELIICGHAHQPFVREVDGVWFVNTGSVGRPDDGDPRACYAILTLAANHFSIEHYRVAYDVAAAVAALREQGQPEAFAQMLLQGRSLDAVRRLPQVWDEPRVLGAVRALALRCQYDAPHAEQVSALAMQLFDALQPLHHLGDSERRLLNFAGLLHDIGWSENGQQHHKLSLRIILESPLLPFSTRERLLIGSVARYHRKALPSLKHDHFAALSPEDQLTVTVLAGLLRMADGLDSEHRGAVDGVMVTVATGVLTVRCTGGTVLSEEERAAALRKADLLSQVFAREVRFAWPSM
jgi:putative phosphoesterase